MTPRWVVYDEPAGGGGGGPWDPSQLSALVAWYKADSLTGVNDGDSVSSLSDSSGTGNDLTVHDANATPVVRTGALNGLNIIEWRAAATTLRNTSSTVFRNVPGLARALVYRQPDTATINADSVSTDTNNNYRFFHQLTVSNTQRHRTKRLVADSYNPSFGTTHGGTPAFTWSIQVDFADFSVPSAGGTSDGTLATQVSIVTSGSTEDTATVVALGGTPDGAGFDVDIAESIYANSAISAADREKLEGYLAHKWGLAGNLPVSHPYKNAAP